MYAGRIAERGAVGDVFRAPLHPYTRGLLRSIPRIGAQRQRRLDAIPGIVPDPLHLPSGCRFRDRCPLAVADCARVDPPLEEHAPAHWAACIRVRDAEMPTGEEPPHR